MTLLRNMGGGTATAERAANPGLTRSGVQIFDSPERFPQGCAPSRVPSRATSCEPSPECNDEELNTTATSTASRLSLDIDFVSKTINEMSIEYGRYDYGPELGDVMESQVEELLQPFLNPSGNSAVCTLSFKFNY